MLTTPTARPSCTRRGFRLPCPACGETRITLALDDITDDGHAEPLKCFDCDHEFTIARVRAMVAAWSACLAWLDTAPVLNDE